MARGNKVEVHDFYCINCGKKGIMLPRKVSMKHSRMHRKKLYCIYCKTEVNHIECRTEEEIEKFKRNFEKGAYKDEADASISLVGCTR